MKFFTVGVYNSSEHGFFNKLVENKIDTFCDIRQRRGVRGAKYAFVNSKRLQQRLAELGIKYLHVRDLAPPKEIRSLQAKADQKAGILKKEREQLGKVFISEYNEKVLSSFSFDDFLEVLERQKANRIVFFCVEERPAACHRSLVSNLLELEYQVSVVEL